MNTKHNWPEILEALNRKGYTIYKVSVIIGKRWDSVRSWGRGSEPKYSDGKALLDLYESVCVPHETTENR